MENQQSKWNINLDKVLCPECGSKQPALRIPKPWNNYYLEDGLAKTAPVRWTNSEIRLLRRIINNIPAEMKACVTLYRQIQCMVSYTSINSKNRLIISNMPVFTN